MDWITIIQAVCVVAFLTQVLIWSLNRNTPKKTPRRRAPRLPGPMKDFETAWLARSERQIKSLTRHGLAGKADLASNPGPFDTRIGGPLIVPKGMTPPSNAMGQPLVQLVLIRLSDLPDTAGHVLPKQGWLQVLLDGHDPWRLSEPTIQSADFQLIHHDDATDFDIQPLDPAVAKDHVAWDAFRDKDRLLSTGFSLTFTPVRDTPPPSHYKLEDLPDDEGGTQAFDEAFDKRYDTMDEQRESCDVMIGGQAVFTQEDIRHDKKYAGFENLIRMSASGAIFSWGDAGEASIMVPTEDLATGRLQNAVFYFDFH